MDYQFQYTNIIRKKDQGEPSKIANVSRLK
jgi:hypothetical protein